MNVDIKTWNRVATIQGDFRYSPLLWSQKAHIVRCYDPNSSFYNFTISCDGTNIGIMGDIPPICIHVGSLKELCNEDVDCYLYSKVDCQLPVKKEINKEKLKEAVEKEEFSDHIKKKDIQNIETIEQLHAILDRKNIPEWFFDENFEKPNSMIVFSLYMACFAARIISEKKLHF